jgi:hypothetical protein
LLEIFIQLIMILNILTDMMRRIDNIANALYT